MFKKRKIFIIAEAGSNHLRNFSRVKKLIDIASNAGADAVKFQSFLADEIATTNRKYNLIKNKFRKYSNNLYDFYKKLELPIKLYKKIINYCKKKRIIFLTSIFGLTSYKMLRSKINVVKIASFESNFYELISEIIKDKKHIIVSTGCIDEKKILKLKKFFQKKNFTKFSVLHCGSLYPLPLQDANLKYILRLKKIFPKNFIGYSDHTLGISTPVAAVSLGAKIIEKHFTINKKDNSPDSFFSLNEKELTEMIRLIREVESSLGQKKKIISKNIKKMQYGMRSYYSNENFKIGTKIKPGMFTALRPYVKYSLYADDYYNFLGKKLRKNIKKNEVLKKEHVKNYNNFNR